ncbi:MAG: hypothetical protein SGARI_004804 [Bacillariaceae sp.]
MGMFGKKKTADAGYGYATEPGAIPVATPVPPPMPAPYVQAQSRQLEKLVVAQPVVATGIPTKSSQAHQSGAFGPMSDDPTLSRGPMIMSQCPHCQQQSRTRVTTAPVWQTWAASGVLCFVFWPIFWCRPFKTVA